MAKQTIKQRKAIRSAAARRTPKVSAKQDAAQERAIGFSDGVAVTRNFYEAMAEHKKGARQMWAADIGCWYHRFEIDGVLEPFEKQRPPSLWQRIKRWLA